jgi:hypothetical protein
MHVFLPSALVGVEGSASSPGRFTPGGKSLRYPLDWRLGGYQLLNTATSSPADDVQHYVIPPKLLDSICNKLPVFMRQWEKEKAVL